MLSRHLPKLTLVCLISGNGRMTATIEIRKTLTSSRHLKEKLLVGANKKALLIKSEELYYNEMEFSALSDLSAPGISPGLELAPFFKMKEVAKASQGHSLSLS